MPVPVWAGRGRVLPVPPQDELRGHHSRIGGRCSLGPGLVLGAGGGPPQSAPRSWAEPHGTHSKVGPQGDRDKVPGGQHAPLPPAQEPHNWAGRDPRKASRGSGWWGQFEGPRGSGVCTSEFPGFVADSDDCRRGSERAGGGQGAGPVSACRSGQGYLGWARAPSASPTRARPVLPSDAPAPGVPEAQTG